MQGNKSTTPRGIDMLELPFNRNGRRKKANLDDGLDLPFIFSSSSVGRSADEGNRFMILWTKPILAGQKKIVPPPVKSNAQVVPKVIKVAAVIRMYIAKCNNG